MTFADALEEEKKARERQRNNKKRKNRQRQFWVLLIINMALLSPPVHELLHGVGCIVQGGKIIELDLMHRTLCFAPTWTERELEFFYSLPFIVPMFFSLFTMFFFLLYFNLKRYVFRS